MRFKKDKIKVLPPIGNIFEKCGHLSMILYNKGHFKFNFLYFDKKNPSFPRRRKMKEKSSKQQNVINISKKRFFTDFNSTCDDVISLAKLTKKSNDAISFDELFIFIYFI